MLRAGALYYIVKDDGLTFLTDLPKRVAESFTRHRLQQTNLLLIEAIESARDGIVITDLQGVILHVNQALEDMFGFPRDQMLGQNTRIFKSGLHQPELYEQLWKRLVNRSSWQGEIVNRRSDGTFLDASLTVSPIVDPRGQLTHFVGIYRDVSERKQMERQLFQAQKRQRVGTPAGGIAPGLGGVLFLLNLMQRLDLAGCFEADWRLASQVGPWGVLELLARGLLSELPTCLEGGNFQRLAADPPWSPRGTRRVISPRPLARARAKRGRGVSPPLPRSVDSAPNAPQPPCVRECAHCPSAEITHSPPAPSPVPPPRSRNGDIASGSSGWTPTPTPPGVSRSLGTRSRAAWRTTPTQHAS